MKASYDCIALIMRFEGLKLTAYKCPAGVWTIGHGTTAYPDGKKVKPGQSITREYAGKLLVHDIERFARGVKALLQGTAIGQSQFDALVSFAYNLGMGALERSTLLKKVKANPQDKTIESEFLKWRFAGGEELAGLVKRRLAESALYHKTNTHELL